MNQEPQGSVSTLRPFYRQLFEVNRSIQLIIDPGTGRIERANPSAAAFYGYPRATLEQMLITDINSQSPAEVHQEMAAARSEERLFFRFQHRLASGELRDVEVYSGPVEVAGRTLLYSIIHDVTVQRKQALELVQARDKLHAVLQSTTVAITWMSADGKLEYVNPRFVELFGAGIAHVADADAFWEAVVPDPLTRDAFLARWVPEAEHARETSSAIEGRELVVRGAGGETRHVMLLASWAGDSLVLTFSDVTEQAERQARMRYMAHHDLLTGLPNRALLSDRLDQHLRRADRESRTLAVLVLDLDGFKPINDHYGHEIGDHVLQVIAHRLRDAVRRSDTVARLGGDEFALVVGDLSSQQACVQLIERTLASIAAPIPDDRVQLQVSASIGVAFYPQREQVDGDLLLRQADQAMYQAKLGGKHTYRVFDVAADRTLRQHHESLNAIRNALENDALVLHYQPIVNMRTGRVLAVEALIRWQHPERGLLQPGAFLPVIEGTSLSVSVGMWVLRRAMVDLSRWLAAGLDIAVSVNVAARQLTDPDFVPLLAELLAAYPLVAPAQLQLEIVETVAILDVAHATRVMDACRALGVRFALDDFGTGYSSLSYLKDLPATTLKVDRSFVFDMLEDHDALSIVEGSLGLAKAFRLDLVAEGVETVDHGVMLLQLGCFVAQGYGIARPMPAAQVGPWIAGWRTHDAWAKQDPIPYALIPALHAATELRAWVNHVDAVLANETGARPLLDETQCRFGAWLAHQRLATPSQADIIGDLRRTHARLHQEATRGLLEGTRDTDALHQLRDAILELLQALLAARLAEL